VLELYKTIGDEMISMVVVLQDYVKYQDFLCLNYSVLAKEELKNSTSLSDGNG